MKVVIGADHRGFALKEALRSYLEQHGHIVEDVGASQENLLDDYPDFAYPAALAVAKGDALGVLLCGSGMGMDIVANKVKGIRATIAKSAQDAAYAREHDDVNVMTLAADELDEATMQAIVDTFLATPFSRAERHVRRLEKLREIEGRHLQ